MNEKFEKDTLLIAEAEKTETATDDAVILIGRSNTSLEAAYLIGDRHAWNYLEFDYAEMAFMLESMVAHIKRLSDRSIISPSSKRSILLSIHQQWEGSRRSGMDPSTYHTASFDTLTPCTRR
jgi:hypothetical protein